MRESLLLLFIVMFFWFCFILHYVVDCSQLATVNKVLFGNIPSCVYVGCVFIVYWGVMCFVTCYVCMTLCWFSLTGSVKGLEPNSLTPHLHHARTHIQTKLVKLMQIIWFISFKKLFQSYIAHKHPEIFFFKFESNEFMYHHLIKSDDVHLL